TMITGYESSQRGECLCAATLRGCGSSHARRRACLFTALSVRRRLVRRKRLPQHHHHLPRTLVEQFFNIVRELACSQQQVFFVYTEVSCEFADQGFRRLGFAPLDMADVSVRNAEVAG